MRTLRWRLVAGVLAGITLLFACGASLTYMEIRSRLYRDFDQTLFQRALSLIAMVKEDRGRFELGRLGRGVEPPGYEPGVDYYLLSSRPGEALVISRDWTNSALDAIKTSADAPRFLAIVLPGDRDGRAVAIETRVEVEVGKRVRAAAARGDATLPQGPLVRMVFARPDTVAAALRDIRSMLLSLWAGCSLLSGLVAWLVVRSGLKPLDELRGQIGAMRDTVTGYRIRLSSPPLELEPVAGELNRMLERVEAALLRERTLTSNVAHELRTPIAGILSTLELTLARERSIADYKEATADCFEIAKRMHWLVNNLLSIARIEAGNVKLHRRSVRLRSELIEWWNPFTVRARERGLQVEWRIPQGAEIHTDGEFLRVVMSNLFDNAVSYAPEGGTVLIRAEGDGSVSVGNLSPELDPQTINRIFEPFWRSNESRSDAGAHAGLGMSLSRKILELLGGTIRAEIDSNSRWFVASIQIAPQANRP
ncbi:MAG: HAMP domain-containing protein [Verrucomicrobia bacterium]|nr:HAMP domain-containing protein [Verrucomicrobiota bacterium]MBI3869383.1 HAMP domain-containing protein [Verrucomicrobiota bacterium]